MHFSLTMLYRDRCATLDTNTKANSHIDKLKLAAWNSNRNEHFFCVTCNQFYTELLWSRLRSVNLLSLASQQICVRDLNHSLCKFVTHCSSQPLLACKGFYRHIRSSGGPQRAGPRAFLSKHVSLAKEESSDEPSVSHLRKNIRVKKNL